MPMIMIGSPKNRPNPPRMQPAIPRPSLSSSLRRTTPRARLAAPMLVTMLPPMVIPRPFRRLRGGGSGLGGGVFHWGGGTSTAPPAHAHAENMEPDGSHTLTPHV